MGHESGEKMVIGIGIDLVSVQRISAVLARHGDRALRRFFTPDEVARAREGSVLAQSLAARFAAKEAFFKALGTGWGRGGSWVEVEVVSAASGAPSLRLHGAAREHASERGVGRMHLSLTHTADSAGAIVVLEA